MPAKGMTDKYANKFYGTVSEAVAGTLAFAEIPTNVSVFDKVAWVIHRLEWYLDPTELFKLVNTGDYIRMGLCSTNSLAALSLADSGVIDMMDLSIHILTAVGFADVPMPISRDFSNLPGGGLIVAPRPLYLAVQGISLASVVTVKARGFFTVLDLNAEDYLELVDFYRIVK